MTTLPKQNETALVKQCLKYLAIEGILAWRNNTGSRQGSYKGEDTYVKYGLCRGSSDIIGVMHDGRFLAIECKIGTAQPTDLQEAFLESVRRQGGLALCIRTLPELVTEIRNAKRAIDETS